MRTRAADVGARMRAEDGSATAVRIVRHLLGARQQTVPETGVDG
jgi:hypothetical protein